MKKIIITLLSLLCFSLLFSQKTNYDSKIFVKELEKAKDYRYQDYLLKYDGLINQNPKDINLKIERCNFIYYSYYDAYEDYTLKYEEFTECVNNLYSTYPENPGVILFKIDNTYGDSLDTILNTARKLISKKPHKWNSEQSSKLYHKLAEKSFNDDKKFNALNFLVNAKAYKDSTDYSIISAKIYLENEKKEKALSELIKNINRDSEVWNLNQKANLLLQLDAPEKALELYERVEQKDSTYIDNTSLFKVFKDLKKHDIARNYLLKDTVYEWNKIAAISKLSTFDLKFSSPEKALVTYRRANQLNFYNDFFGMKRIKLFFKSPFLGWNFTEISQLIIGISSLFFLFILPYIIILPIQFVGERLNFKPLKLSVPFDWTLKHFWLVIFAYFLIDFLLFLIFDYEGLLNKYFSVSILEEKVVINLQHHVFYFFLMSFATLLFFNKKRIHYLINSKIRGLRIISLFVLFMLINYTILRFLKSDELSLMPMLNIKEIIKELILQYGFGMAFLFVVILGPIYEEIIFRGIILSSVEKHIGFWKANLIQSVLFALVHDDFSIFLYYTFFALILGLLVRNSKGLLVGILFHAGNNLLVLISLYFLVMNGL